MYIEKTNWPFSGQKKNIFCFYSLKFASTDTNTEVDKLNRFRALFNTSTCLFLLNWKYFNWPKIQTNKKDKLQIILQSMVHSPLCIFTTFELYQTNRLKRKTPKGSSCNFESIYVQKYFFDSGPCLFFIIFFSRNI